MMKRYLRIPGGQWCAAVIEDQALPDGQEYAERACATYGLPAGSLEVVDVDDDSDPRDGAYIDVAPSPAPEIIEAPPSLTIEEITALKRIAAEAIVAAPVAEVK